MLAYLLDKLPGGISLQSNVVFHSCNNHGVGEGHEAASAAGGRHGRWNHLPLGC
jgi:hypothetical protein